MNEWISVKVALPSRGRHVLTWCEANETAMVQYRSHDDEIEDWNWFIPLISGCSGIGNVSHWMPLPEPPKENI
jgi:hypothetical protein